MSSFLLLLHSSIHAAAARVIQPHAVLKLSCCPNAECLSSFVRLWQSVTTA